jgi:hypothetical protein
VPEFACPGDRRGQIEHLAVADRGTSAGGAVAPEGERDHGPVLRERLGRPTYVRLVHIARETVRDDERGSPEGDREASYTGVAPGSYTASIVTPSSVRRNVRKGVPQIVSEFGRTVDRVT